jgi:hypothetical protein
VRSAALGGLVLTMIVVALSAGWAADRREETVLTVEVSSAEHEVEEGYFALGENATVMAKPGSDLHRFLTRHRGRTVRIVLSREDTRELSRVRRE